MFNSAIQALKENVPGSGGKLPAAKATEGIGPLPSKLKEVKDGVFEYDLPEPEPEGKEEVFLNALPPKPVDVKITAGGGLHLKNPA